MSDLEAMEAKLADLEEKVAGLQAEKEELVAAVEAKKDEIRVVLAERDPLFMDVQALQSLRRPGPPAQTIGEETNG